MANLSQINRKIKSIKTTCKVTEALKIVSSNKFAVYKDLQKKSLPYLKGIYKLFFELYINPDHIIKYSNRKLIRTDNSKKTLWVVLGTDIGMCSDFNEKIKNYLISVFDKNLDGIFVLGKKLSSSLSSIFPEKIEFSRLSEINISNASSEVKEITNEIFKTFFSKNYLRLSFIYLKDVKNSIIEKINILPFTENYFSNQKKINIKFLYTSLSYPDVIVDLFPHYLECLLLSSLISSKVSEHTLRRDLMHNATKNANELLDSYVISYNKLRQAAITQEISEIVVAVQTKKE